MRILVAILLIKKLIVSVWETKFFANSISCLLIEVFRADRLPFPVPLLNFQSSVRIGPTLTQPQLNILRRRGNHAMSSADYFSLFVDQPLIRIFSFTCQAGNAHIFIVRTVVITPTIKEALAEFFFGSIAGQLIHPNGPRAILRLTAGNNCSS